MKSTLKSRTAWLTLVTMTLMTFLSLTAPADIAPPPAPLRRIGFEIFKKKPQIKETAPKGQQPTDDEWKYPSQVTPQERKEFLDRISQMQEEMQRRFDEEYARMDKANQLERIGLFSGRYHPSVYYKGQRAIKEANTYAVVKKILTSDAKIRAHYDGVPIEWIIKEISCPDPSVDESSLKDAFRKWAMSQMPRGLNGVERQIVFEWQFAVYEEIKAPWRRAFMDSHADEWEGDLHHIVESDDTDALNKDPDRSRKKLEFGQVSACLPAREYVLEWANFAKLAKHPFAKHPFNAIDKMLIDKANNPSSDFGKLGIVGFMYDRESYYAGFGHDDHKRCPHAKLTFRGDLDCADVELAANYCQQLRKDNDWHCELEELRFNACSPKTVKTVLDKLSGWRIHSQIVVTGGQNVSAELSGIRNLEETDRLILKNVKFGKGTVPFKAPLVTHLYFIDCEVVDLAFVREFENAYELHFSSCRQVTGCAALANLARLRKLSIYGCPWEGTDWPSVIKSCPGPVKVRYDEKFVPADKIDAFKQLLKDKWPRNW